MPSRRYQIDALMLTILLTASVQLVGSTKIAKAQAGTAVYVEPSEIRDIFSPNQFTVSVKLANVSNLYGLDIQFTWDPNIIKYVSLTKRIPRSTANPDGVIYSPTLPIMNAVDETASLSGSEPGTRYWLAEASMLPAKPFNGSGTIFEMTFEVVGLGTSPLQILACSLADASGVPISAAIEQGSFSNYTPPPPLPADVFVSPSSIIDSGLTPSHNFTIIVNVTGVEGLYSFSFDLTCNASVLETVSATVNSIFSFPTIVASSGKIHIAASLTAPAPAIEGNLSLTSIELHVVAEGETALNLGNLTLLDNVGANIDVNEPIDGYFNNMQIFLIPATVSAQIETLNLKGVGKWIAFFVELPSGYSVNDVTASSIMLNETVPADLTIPPGIGDFDNDSDPDLRVSFNRADVIGFILLQRPTIRNESIALALSGELINAAMFAGSAGIAISPITGDVDCNGIVDIIDIVIASALSYESVDGDTNWNPNANFAPSFDKIDIFDLVTAVFHYKEILD